MGQRPVRTGVIGVGVMGERHARLYAQSPGAELVGVYDADTARADAVAARWGTRAFASVEQLLDAVEAVSVASPTHTHAALAHLALDRRIHLLVEKPLADSLDAARRLATRAAWHPAIVFQVGHIERFNPVVRELERLLRGQRLLSLTMRRLSPFDGRCLDTDVVQDLMIHDLDLALALCGGDLELDGAHGGTLLSPRTDYAAAHLRGPGDVRLTLEASRVANRKVRAITAFTDRERIDADLLGKTIAVTRHAAGGWADEGRVIPADEPLGLELASFLACVRRRESAVVGAADGLMALTYAEAISALIARRAGTARGELVAVGDGVAAG